MASQGHDFDLGSCCACGKTGADVRNLLALPYRAPVAGTGWGCVVCGLPADGAIAVLCDDCLEQGRDIRFICSGYAGANVRVPLAVDGGRAPFDHIKARHDALF